MDSTTYKGCEVESLVMNEKKEDNDVVHYENGIYINGSFMMYAALYPKIMVEVTVTEKDRVKPDEL